MPEHSRTLFDVNLGAAAQRFKEAFARELLLSERLRVTILMGVFLFVAVYAALFVLLSRWGVLLLFPESDARLAGVIVVVMLGAALYEFFTRQFVTRRLRQALLLPA